MTRILLLAVTPILAAADWPRFRGPNGTGVAEAGTPVTWTKSDILWEAKPGTGNGSPVVAGGKVYLQAASGDGTKRLMVCLDAKTGKQEWATPVGGGKGKVHAKNSLASGTPAVADGRVFCLFWDGNAVALHAFDLAGKELWSQSLGSFRSQHGAGHSPMVVGDKVIVNFDQDDKAEVVAFDVATGSRAWAKDRKAYRSCYTTPILRERPDTKPELIVTSTAGITGYDPATGAENWSFAWKFDAMALRTVGGPVIVGNTIIAVSGDGGGSRHAVAVELGTGKLLWEKKKDSPYVPSPVALGDHVYWITDAGIAMCLDVKTGAVAWDERVFPKAVSASLLLIGDMVFAVAEDGKTAAFKASSAGFEKVGEADLKEAVFATPAAAEGRLYLRTATRLVCVGGKK
jgi:outer membrane protein assembly factor BamB